MSGFSLNKACNKLGGTQGYWMKFQNSPQCLFKDDLNLTFPKLLNAQTFQYVLLHMLRTFPNEAINRLRNTQNVLIQRQFVVKLILTS